MPVSPEGGSPYLSLTQDTFQYQSGSGWYVSDQSVSAGFTSVFQFQITHSGFPADGIAFVIQNCASCDGQTSALGNNGGGIGYAGIDNSLAIEFDTYQNSELGDPNANHVAVQSCGTNPNTSNHLAGCTLGIQAMPGINLTDGNVHTVILQYDPGVEGPGLLSIYVDNGGVPVLVVPLQIETLLNLNANEDGTYHAYVGF